MLNQEKMPGAGSVTDTIDFMKQIWGSMGAPSMVTPSLSVEDINKKIGDLKTVASWLELNLNMLKATIQTMEVQSATLSTLQAMSAIMASQGAPASQEEAAGAQSFPFGFPMWPGAAPQPEEPAAEAEAEPEAAAAEEPEPEPASAADDTEAGAEPPAGALPDFQSAMANPNAWWNVLQEQFKHAVGNAMSGAQSEQEPLLKPVRPGAAAGTSKASKTAKAANRSKNKTVTPPKPKARPAVPKAKPAGASRGVKAATKPAKAAAGKPAAGKARKTPANTSASARAAVVQSRQNKKPASRKPTSP